MRVQRWLRRSVMVCVCGVWAKSDGRRREGVWCGVSFAPLAYLLPFTPHKHAPQSTQGKALGGQATVSRLFLGLP